MYENFPLIIKSKIYSKQYCHKKLLFSTFYSDSFSKINSIYIEKKIKKDRRKIKTIIIFLIL